jgi:hypothetical protein
MSRQHLGSEEKLLLQIQQKSTEKGSIKNIFKNEIKILVINIISIHMNAM